MVDTDTAIEWEAEVGDKYFMSEEPFLDVGSRLVEKAVGNDGEEAWSLSGGVGLVTFSSIKYEMVTWYVMAGESHIALVVANIGTYLEAVMLGAYNQQKMLIIIFFEPQIILAGLKVRP